ncbi:ATP-binding protein [Serpentinimonas maccroryi]|uniref:ATP-binding protein n=1 Tax=Serpentinimonas maccroryi TaxID=1458426 RepID=UPI0020334F79|nr:ATP-binding protein [Serpentinimonas maccroryi]MCM2479484.1 ATP-binding protein [Serpentinimonas maccroryi]
MNIITQHQYFQLQAIRFELELGSAAVFIGPNNSGKTTALQALALWDFGWLRWVEKRGKSSPAER